VMTVRRHDGWYVSPLYTLAEYIRESQGYEEADFDASRGTVEGAASPEQAVSALVPAIEELDPEQALAALPTGEFGFARDYLDSVVAGGGMDGLDDTRADLRLDIRDLQLTEGEDLGDGRRKVDVDGVTYRFHDADADADAEVRVEGTCADVHTEGQEAERTCLTDLLATEAGLDPGLADLVPETPFVVVVERDGGWYVSPVETLAEYLRYALDRVDDDDLAALGLVQPEPGAVGERVHGELASPFRRDVRTFDLEEGTAYAVRIGSASESDVRIAVSPTDGEGSGAGSADAATGGVRPATSGLFVATETSYEAVIAVDPDSVPRDARGEPVPFTYVIEPVEVQGTITTGEPLGVDLDEGGAALYEFESTDNQRVRVQLAGPARVTILDPTGQPIDASRGQTAAFYDAGRNLVLLSSARGGAAIVLFAPAAGLPEESSVAGPDSLEGIPQLEIGPAEAVELGPDQIVDRVFVGTGGRLRIVAAGGDNRFDPMLSVYDDELELVGNNAGNASDRRAEVVINTQKGATYVVSAAAYDGAPGQVLLRVVPRD
jgi:hypothetical protein